MLSYFPGQISNRAIGLYFISLALVSIIFIDHVMPFRFILIGIVFVFLFFYGSANLTLKWKKLNEKDFTRNLFIVSLLINVLWVTFSYFFYISETGKPFEYDAADALSYHSDSSYLCTIPWKDVFVYLNTYWGTDGGDHGYFIYLTSVYKIFGPNIFVVRIIKCFLKAYMCVLIYRLASRNFGEKVGKMAAIFCMLMPNLIIYCGLHIKELEMTTLALIYVDRADKLLRTKKYTFIDVSVTILSALSLFFFRMVLGAVAVIAFFVGLVFTSSRVINKGKKVLMILVGVVFLGVMAGGTIVTELEGLWDTRSENAEMKRYQQTINGNMWAKYATATVMAPMIFVVPFATMVDTDQYNQCVLHGGNFTKNFMAIFVIIAFVNLVFKTKKWRDYSFLGSFVIGYLGIIAFSGYSNAERFHFPALPFLLIFIAYGVSLVNVKNIKYVKYWSILVVFMEFGWAFFKLGSRGIVGV